MANLLRTLMSPHMGNLTRLIVHRLPERNVLVCRSCYQAIRTLSSSTILSSASEQKQKPKKGAFGFSFTIIVPTLYAGFDKYPPTKGKPPKKGTMGEKQQQGKKVMYVHNCHVIQYVNRF